MSTSFACDLKLINGKSFSHTPLNRDMGDARIMIKLYTISSNISVYVAPQTRSLKVDVLTTQHKLWFGRLGVGSPNVGR